MPFEGGTFEGRDGLAAPSSRAASTGSRSVRTATLEIDAHYTLLTEADEAIEVVSQGLAPGTDDPWRPGWPRVSQVDPDEYYFRTLVRLSTPAPRLTWLNHLARRLHGKAGRRHSCASTCTRSCERRRHGSAAARVVGAGIGGLTAALSLHEIGVRVDVFDSVKAVRPLGVGINLLPHAVRELDALGLLDELSARSARACAARLLHAARPGDLAGAARPGRRVPVAPDLVASGRPAGDPPAGIDRSRGC